MCYSSCAISLLCVIFLLCVIDFYSKYGWVVLLADKKGITVINKFFSMNLIVNQTKYGSIKMDNFTIDQ